MKKRVFFLLLIVFYLFTSFAPISHAQSLYNSEIEPRSGILYLKSLDDGTVIFDRGATERCAPAALVSIVTAMLAIQQNPNLEKMYTVPENINDILAGTNSAIMLLKGGEKLRIVDLLYCILIRSAADASVTLAYGVAGSEKDFVAKMNDYAASLGCNSTHFVNVTGLDDDNQYTTAEDMARIMAEASKNETFKKISMTESYEVPATNLSEERPVYTTNLMLKSGYRSYYYEYITAAKSGATSNAGRCVALTATKDGYSYVAVVMKGPYIDTDGNGVEENYAFIDCKAMLKWTFSNIRLRTIADVNQIVGEMEVRYSLRTDHIQLVPSEKLTALVPAGIGTENVVFEILPEQTKEYVNAPVKKGDVLGKANILYSGTVIAVTDLVAADDVAFDLAGFFFSVFKNITSSPWIILCILLVIGLLLFLIFGFRYDKKLRRLVWIRGRKKTRRNS